MSSSLTRVRPTVRFLPFLALSLFSLWFAYQAPGRKPFGLDLDLSPVALSAAMTKVSHLCASALVFSLAVLAVGRQRLGAALGLTLLMGLGWELMEGTGRGRHACLADLAPDLASALVCLMVTAVAFRAR
jgi:hypothetical protein